VERDLDGVDAHPEQLADLLRGQVGAVAEGDELAVACVEGGDGAGELEPPDGVAGEVARGRPLRHLLDRLLAVGHVRGDAAARDPDQPRDRVALRRVEAVAVAERAREGLGGDVLRVGAVADPVGDVRVDAANQPLRVGEGVAPHRLSLVRSGSDVKSFVHARDYLPPPARLTS